MIKAAAAVSLISELAVLTPALPAPVPALLLAARNVLRSSACPALIYVVKSEWALSQALRRSLVTAPVSGPTE